MPLLSSQISDMFVDLHRVHEHLVAIIDTRLMADCGLTLGRVEVLGVIAQQGTCRVNDIAIELGITWGGTSKIVDRLEAAQLCKRRPNPEDGRSSLIKLTAAGERSLAKANKIMTIELDAQLAPVLNARTLSQFAASCSILRDSTRTESIAARTA